MHLAGEEQPGIGQRETAAAWVYPTVQPARRVRKVCGRRYWFLWFPWETESESSFKIPSRSDGCGREDVRAATP